MDTQSVADKLVEFCRAGQHVEAVNALYADDIVSVEPRGSEVMAAEMSGIEAVRGKNVWWLENHDIHSSTAEGPMLHGDRFTVIYDFDVTSKLSGERMRMKEVALYTVDGGKVVREEFFY